jgi:hypothetical protein
MAALTRSVVFRVTRLLIGKTEEIRTSLRPIIEKQLSTLESLQLKFEVSLILLYDDGHTLATLVDFKNSVPLFLNRLLKDPLEDFPIETGDGDINFNRHFFSFTQLYYLDLARPVGVE